MGAAPAGTAIRAGPGAGLEAAAEAVLALVPLVVVGEVLGPVDVPADVLTLGPRHDSLVPMQQPVVPVTLLVYLDIAAVYLSGGLGGCCWCCSSGGWYERFSRRRMSGGWYERFSRGGVGGGWNQRSP